MTEHCTGAKAHRWETLKAVPTTFGRRLLQTCAHCPEFRVLDSHFDQTDPREKADRWLARK